MQGDVCTGTADVPATCFVNGDSHFPNHVTCRKIPVSKVTDFVSSHARQLKSADTDGVSVLSFSRKCPERKSIPPSGAFSQRRQMTGFLFFFGCNPCIFTRFLCYREKTHDFSQETCIFTQSAFFVHKACFCFDSSTAPAAYYPARVLRMTSGQCRQLFDRRTVICPDHVPRMDHSAVPKTDAAMSPVDRTVFLWTENIFSQQKSTALMLCSIQYRSYRNSIFQSIKQT